MKKNLDETQLIIIDRYGETKHVFESRLLAIQYICDLAEKGKPFKYKIGLSEDMFSFGSIVRVKK